MESREGRTFLFTLRNHNILFFLSMEIKVFSEIWLNNLASGKQMCDFSHFWFHIFERWEPTSPWYHSSNFSKNAPTAVYCRHISCPNEVVLGPRGDPSSELRRFEGDFPLRNFLHYGRDSNTHWTLITVVVANLFTKVSPWGVSSKIYLMIILM